MGRKSIPRAAQFAGTLRILAASSALCGRHDDAQKAIARACQLDPNSRISNIKDRVGRFRPEDFIRYAEGLRIARLSAMVSDGVRVICRSD
jgi:hypothetical protein